MKKIIFILALFGSFVANAQYTPPTGYTNINSRYDWLAGVFRALGLPAGGNAAFTTGQAQRAGSVYYDSTGVDAGLYVWSGSAWVKSSYTDGDARAAISLTTTGTSGAATYNSGTGVFNIPQYTGVTTFVGLTDGPGSFTGQTGKSVRVNAGETALEYFTPASPLGTYIVQTATNAPVNAQILASLGTGLLKNTTTTGVLSIATGADLPSGSSSYIQNQIAGQQASSNGWISGTFRADGNINIGVAAAAANALNITATTAQTSAINVRSALSNGTSIGLVIRNAANAGNWFVNDDGAQTMNGLLSVNATGRVSVKTTSGYSSNQGAVTLERTFSANTDNARGFRDNTIFSPSTAALAYAAYDARPVMSGSVSHNHVVSFQSYLDIQAAGTITNVYDVFASGNIGTSATVTNRYGLKVETPTLTGGAVLTNSYGVYVSDMTTGTNKWGFYQAGANAKNHFGGATGINSTSPTAYLHIGAGTTAASTAPLKFTQTSAALNTTAEAGAVEVLTDKIYYTINTGAARKEFTLNDAALTSGRIPFVTTNGRLTDVSTVLWDGTTATFPLLKITGGSPGAGKVLTSDADGDATWTTATKPTLTKNAMVESPTATENLFMFRTPVAITVTDVTAVLVGGTPSVTYNIAFGTDRSSGTNVYTAGQTVTSETTGTAASGVNDATIPAGSWVWITTSAATDVTQLNISLTYTED